MEDMGQMVEMGDGGRRSKVVANVCAPNRTAAAWTAVRDDSWIEWHSR